MTRIIIVIRIIELIRIRRVYDKTLMVFSKVRVYVWSMEYGVLACGLAIDLGDTINPVQELGKVGPVARLVLEMIVVS